MAIYDPESNQHSDGSDSEVSIPVKSINNIIKESYVYFSIAKLLKKKAYKIPSKLHYPESREQEKYCLETDWNSFTDMVGSNYYFTKPTTALAIKWLKENYGSPIIEHLSYDMSDEEINGELEDILTKLKPLIQLEKGINK